MAGGGQQETGTHTGPLAWYFKHKNYTYNKTELVIQTEVNQVKLGGSEPGWWITSMSTWQSLAGKLTNCEGHRTSLCSISFNSVWLCRNPKQKLSSSSQWPQLSWHSHCKRWESSVHYATEDVGVSQIREKVSFFREMQSEVPLHTHTRAKKRLIIINVGTYMEAPRTHTVVGRNKKWYAHTRKWDILINLSIHLPPLNYTSPKRKRSTYPHNDLFVVNLVIVIS